MGLVDAPQMDTGPEAPGSLERWERLMERQGRFFCKQCYSCKQKTICSPPEILSFNHNVKKFAYFLDHCQTYSVKFVAIMKNTIPSKSI